MLQQKCKMLEAELSIIAVFPFASVLFSFVQCSPPQTKRRLILRWNECKVIPGCWVTKRICEVHYTGLGFGMGRLEGEKGPVPTSWRICRGRGQIQNHLQPHEAEGNVCFGMCTEVQRTQFTAALAACHSILFTGAYDIHGPRAVIMVSDVTVLLAQEIFMDLIRTIYRHCVVSDTFKKTTRSRRGTASL